MLDKGHDLMTVRDRKDKRDVVTIQKTIHSIRFDRKLMEAIVDIIEEGYNDVKDDKYSSTSYNIKEKDIETKYESPTNFLKNELTADTKQIFFHLHSNNKKIIVILINSIYRNSEFMVEGNDSTWVHGKSDLLSRLLVKFKTPNDFFHSNKRWFVYVPAAIFFAVITGISISDDGVSGLLFAVSWSVSFTIIFNFVLGWLFPKNETQYLKQVNFRRRILSALGVIFLGLIVNFIWHLANGISRL